MEPFGVGTAVQAPDGRPSRILIRDTWNTEILDELAPEPGDIIVSKHRFSGFYQTDLDMILNSNTGNLSYTLHKAPRLAAQLRTLFGNGSTLLKGINPALPALMTGLVEAESAFGGTDANGHFVRVMSVTPGTCTVGINAGCSGGPNDGGPAVTGGVPGTSSKSGGQNISDRGLENLLFGSH